MPARLAEQEVGRDEQRLGDGQFVVTDEVGQGGERLVATVADLVVLRPEMARGQGVTIQKYKDGGLADVISFRFEEGLSWPMGGETGRRRTEADVNPWRVARGAAGRMPPLGFPRDNKFE